MSRELRRNRSTNGYDPHSAHGLSITRKHTAVKSNKLNAKTDDLIEKGLCLGWSPDAISRRMKLENLPKDEPLSHTTIYRRVAKDRQQGGQLYRDLPRFGKTESAIGRQVRRLFLGEWILQNGSLLLKSETV